MNIKARVEALEQRIEVLERLVAPDEANDLDRLLEIAAKIDQLDPIELPQVWVEGDDGPERP